MQGITRLPLHDFTIRKSIFFSFLGNSTIKCGAKLLVPTFI